VAFALANTSENAEVILAKLMDQDILETIKAGEGPVDGNARLLATGWWQPVEGKLQAK
jgi:hypothetical protein